MTPPLALTDLVAQPSRVTELGAVEARVMLAELVALQGLVLTRVLTSEPAAVPPEPARLLTVPEAAERLAIPSSFLYELIRQGRVPAQRIGPKYVRLHPETVEDIQRRGLDSGLSGSYSPNHDGIGTRRAARSLEADAGGVRRRARRPREYAGAVRARRDRDPRAGRALGAAPGASA